MRSVLVIASVSLILAAGGCADDDAGSCADLRERLAELEATVESGQSFDDVEAQVDRTTERDAVAAELAAPRCSEG